MSEAVPGDPAVTLRDVTFGYGADEDVLKVSRFEAAAGERVFVHGPSGCGKTTLLGLVAGVLKARTGVVEVLGRDLNRMPTHERDAFRAAELGYIFQLFNLIPYLTVLENIVLPCQASAARRQRLGPVSLERAATDLATNLGLGDLLDRRAAELSVGQQQRAAAARALIAKPRLVIADEPTSSLDSDARDLFLDLLLQQGRKESCTVIFVSHDRSLSSLFDRAVSLPQINALAAGEARC